LRSSLLVVRQLLAGLLTHIRANGLNPLQHSGAKPSSPILVSRRNTPRKRNVEQMANDPLPEESRASEHRDLALHRRMFVRQTRTHFSRSKFNSSMFSLTSRSRSAVSVSL